MATLAVSFREPGAARAGGYVLAVATVLLPAGGFEERPSVLQNTPWRGIGSATGLYFLEPLIFANIPAFLWLGYVGRSIAAAARS